MNIIKPGFTTRATLAILVSCLVVAGCSGSGGSSPSDPNAGFVGMKAVPAGTWGGSNAEIDVTPTTDTMTIQCLSVTMTGPITPDGIGDFVVPGTFTAVLPTPTNVLFVGHAADGRMHVMMIDATTHTLYSSYDLVYGTTLQTGGGVCPG